MRAQTLFTVGLALGLQSLPAGAYKELDAVAGGDVSGVVKLGKPAPKKSAAKVTQDPQACGQTQVDETYVVGSGGGLANVVVFLDGIAEGKKGEPGTVEVNQRRCRFDPHVTAFQKGTTLVLKNSDPVLHNVHTHIGASSTLFNLALPMEGSTVSKKVSTLGVVKFRCDAGHSWMSAYSYVTDHPYVTVTDGEGKFVLTAVPPGTYTVKTWHEDAGERTATVTVTQGTAAKVALTY